MFFPISPSPPRGMTRKLVFNFPTYRSNLGTKWGDFPPSGTSAEQGLTGSDSWPSSEKGQLLWRRRFLDNGPHVRFRLLAESFPEAFQDTGDGPEIIHYGGTVFLSM